MRLWSLHPKYLDASGLTACWREGLLARKVLMGKTRGYRHHPQLERFRQTDSPVATMDVYLSAILAEARQRAYRFDATKINPVPKEVPSIPVTNGQLYFERQHLLEKLKKRSPEQSRFLEQLTSLQPHPLFIVTDGKPEPWEKASVHIPVPSGNADIPVYPPVSTNIRQKHKKGTHTLKKDSKNSNR